MHKTQRQNTILKLIFAKRIESQAELAEMLEARNFNVTQASISRDLDELGIIKANGAYTLPQKPKAAAAFGLLSIDTAGDNLIVARCEPGIASAAAVRIDASMISGIAGTIAGDDTIFIAVKDAKAQRNVMRKVWEVFES